MKHDEEFTDSVLEIVTPLNELDISHHFTVARSMENDKCVELHYNDGHASIEITQRVDENTWEEIDTIKAKWFNPKMSENKLLNRIDRLYERYFEPEKSTDYER